MHLQQLLHVAAVAGYTFYFYILLASRRPVNLLLIRFMIFKLGNTYLMTERNIIEQKNIIGLRNLSI